MAIPAILQQLGKGQMGQTAARIKQMMGMVRGAANPQQALNMLAMNNPQMKQVMEIVDQYGGDSMKAFQEMAKQCGVDPEEILGMLK